MRHDTGIFVAGPATERCQIFIRGASCRQSFPLRGRCAREVQSWGVLGVPGILAKSWASAISSGAFFQGAADGSSVHT